MPHASASRQVMLRSYVHYTAIRRAGIVWYPAARKGYQRPG